MFENSFLPIDRILQEAFFADKVYEKPTEWAENHRIMPPSNPIKGPFSYDPNPYMREIVNMLETESQAQWIVIMKGAQIGVSTCFIENGIGWLIKHNPTNILLASGDDKLVKDQFKNKIDPMIDSAGLRPLIKNTTQKKRNMNSGDTNTEKEFPGGTLRGRSLQSVGNWRQFSAQYLFIDDADAAPKSDKKEGSIVKLIEQRAAAYGTKAKKCYISTPTYKHESIIEPLYLKGDQRRYMVPCPCCGDHIPLEFQLKIDNEIYGIVWDVDEEGNMIKGSTRYRCQSCGDSFEEKANKYQMLKHGYWQPTAKPSKEGFFSYHISALYAPPGMNDWEHYAKEFIEANKSGDEGELKTFMNVVLGKTWEEKSRQPSSTKISMNTRDYEIGIVPCAMSRRDGNGEIVLLTCSADLNGIDDSNPRFDYDDVRIDYEVIAHSERGATYSVDQGSIGTFQRRKKIEGRRLFTYKHDVVDSVWPIFAEILKRQYGTDDGKQMRIAITGVDVGAYSMYVWDFIKRMNGQAYIVGVRGEPETKKVRVESEDKAYFSISSQMGDLYNLRTNIIKNDLSDYMQLVWPRGQMQPEGFMNFPQPSSGKYTVRKFFSQFEAEEKIIDTNAQGENLSYRWAKKTSSSQNHFWDCRVYNMALSKIIMTLVCREMKLEVSWANFCESLKK